MEQAMEQHMCAFCGCDWSRVRVYLEVVRIVLCDGCHTEAIRAAMAFSPIGVPAPWSDISSSLN
jgi:hypothetical protein